MREPSIIDKMVRLRNKRIVAGSYFLSLLLVSVAAVSIALHAAPIPGTSSSPLVSSQPGQFYSTKGFRLDAAQTAWLQRPPPKHIPSLVTVYRSPVQQNGQQAALTVRIDDLQTKQPLQKYVKKWMRDYSRFGFDVLTAKPIKLKNNSAFLLDIVSRETEKQIRQIVLIKNKTAVIMTCRDHRDTFAKTVQDCNEIMKTFSWVSVTE